MLCAGLFTLLPTGQALMAPLNVQTTKQKTNSSAVLTPTIRQRLTAASKDNSKSTTPAKADTKKAEEKVIPPAETQTAWTPAGSSSKLASYYDANSLKYDQKTGIITAWTKWVYTTSASDRVKTVLLLSQYDVRIKVFADLYYLNYDAKGILLKEGPAPDTSWSPISMNTLGEDMRTALNNYLISH